MTLREAWRMSNQTHVYRNDMPESRKYGYLDKIAVWKAIDENWTPLPPPESEKLPLSQALRKWRRTRRAIWGRESAIGLDAEGKLCNAYAGPSPDDLDATDWVEAR